MIMQTDKRCRFHKYGDSELLQILENSDVESDIVLVESDDREAQTESGPDSDDDLENDASVVNISNLSVGRWCLVMIYTSLF